MKHKLFAFSIPVIFVLFTALSYWSFSKLNNVGYSKLPIVENENEELAFKEMLEFQFNRLKDIKTNSMPKNYRENELKFAQYLPVAKLNKSTHKGNSIKTSEWLSEGPNNQGGRTKAIVTDIANENILIAAAAAGGIWRSTDKGATWTNTLSPSFIQNVTCIVQDTRAGKRNIWYAGTGELQSNTAFFFLGNGIYKSVDNGLTWNPLVSTQSNSPHSFSNRFQIVWNIEIDNVHGLIYAAVAAGIYYSADEGATWTLAISGSGNYTSVAVNKNGRAYAVVGSGNSNGIYYSDNGINWTTITPTFWPTNVSRVVSDVSQSNPNILYVLANTPGVGQAGADGEGENGKISLWKYNAATSSWTNLSSSLPTFNPPVSGYTSQYGYDMLIKIKPDDENFVIIGGTNLYRTTDGFATKLTDADWIGGYATVNDISQYANHHPDQHAFYYLPSNTKIAYSAHDGGISVCNDITASSITWTSLNPGYITTQFWSVALDKATANSQYILGGMQDNGTMIDNSAFSTSSWTSVNSGDGTFTAIADGANYIYTSSQNANIYRMNTAGEDWTQVTPANASGFLFVTPFILDPNNTNVMYLLAGNKVWRNSDLTQIPLHGQNPTTVNWSSLNGSVAGSQATALAMSKAADNLLYVGDNSGKLYKINNASDMSSQFIDITGASFPEGGYISTVAVDPNNGNNVMVGFSNYKILSLFFSSNGGTTWTEVGGNLEENADGSGAGPSIRSVKILPIAGGYIYFAGTSIGLYSTSLLNGRNTVWALEAPNSIGNTVVETIDIRKVDGTVIAGTFGKGLYSTRVNASAGTPKAVASVQTLTLHSYPGQTGTAKFTLSNEGNANLTYSISVSGDLTSAPEEISKKRYIIKKGKSSKNLFDRKGFSGNSSLVSKRANNKTIASPKNISGNDVLVLDDGNNTPDTFLGYDDYTDFLWCNEFDLGTNPFSLDSFLFFMRTKGASQNNIRVDVYDKNGNSVAGGDLSLDLSEEGSWYTITLNSPIQFQANDVFYLAIETKMGYIEYPAATDNNGAVGGKSYFWDKNNSSWASLSDAGYTNAAFLIRAVGTLGSGTTNQKPKAVANVSPMTAKVNEQINFDASASTDADGQITGYLWEFGDGTTSTQKTVQHSYSQAKTYTYKLTVTDNNGATDQAAGLIVVSEAQNSKVTVSPSNGTISPNSSQQITVTLDAGTVNEGTYTGQLNIVSNGGNITIPIDYMVDVEIENGTPKNYSLSQNYPNPFNPSTRISFSIPQSDNVKLVVFDLLGRKVATLVDENLSAGNYNITFSAGNSFSSGIYIYTLTTNNFSDSKKLILIK